MSLNYYGQVTLEYTLNQFLVQANESQNCGVAYVVLAARTARTARTLRPQLRPEKGGTPGLPMRHPRSQTRLRAPNSDAANRVPNPLNRNPPATGTGRSGIGVGGELSCSPITDLTTEYFSSPFRISFSAGGVRGKLGAGPNSAAPTQLAADAKACRQNSLALSAGLE